MANNTNKSPNRMTLLLNKIERRLGLKVLKLPNELAKDSWHTIIEEETIPTFSRYFPDKITVIIDNKCFKDGFYFIDKDIPEGVTIIGVKDVDWNMCKKRFGGYATNINFATYDFMAMDYMPEDIGLVQASADYLSLFNLGIYPEFEKPNKIRLVSVNGNPISRYMAFPLEVFIEHQPNLMTISPTMMESFEHLAMADVATFIYQNLKYYDGLDTVFGNLDLKLDTLQEWAGKRDEIVNQLDEAHTSCANESQYMMITV